MKPHQMRYPAVLLSLLGALALPQFATAQDQPAPPDKPATARPGYGELQVPPLAANNDAQAVVQFGNEAATPLPERLNVQQRRIQDERQRLEARVRGMLVGLGVPDAGVQDALLSYLEQDEKSKILVRAAAGRILTGLKRNLPPERMRELITGYKNALDNDRERRMQAQASLDAKIGYSTNPNLEALLWVTGVLGEGGMLLNTNQFNNRMRPANRNDYNGTIAVQGAMNGQTYGNGPVNIQSAMTLGRSFCIGIICAKTDNSVDVRDDNGQVEQYVPLWVGGTGLDGNFERRTLDDIARVQIGQRVRIEWTQMDRKRLVNIKPLPEPEIPARPTEKQ